MDRIASKLSLVLFVGAFASAGCVSSPGQGSDPTGPAASSQEGVATHSPALAVESVNSRTCFSSAHCPDGEVCVDPRYPICAFPPFCDPLSGTVACGCQCRIPCTEGSCGLDEVCDVSGCCVARPCRNAHDCGVHGDHCVNGACVERGTCQFPPP